MALLPLPARTDKPELLDAPAAVCDDLPGNLRDMRLLNRWFGGTAHVRRGVRRLVSNRKEVEVLDVATGSADIPVALIRWGRRAGIALHVVGMDISEEVLAEARVFVRGDSVRLVRGDAVALPWQSDSFDVVTCCLALHHFAPDEAVQVLREMWRVCRVGIVVTDLRRGYGAYLGTWLVARTLARNRVTKHDGPLSVLRAYTPAEVQTLCRRAGLGQAWLYRHPLFRQTLVARKDVRPG